MLCPILLRANEIFSHRIGKGTIRDVFDDVFDDDHARHSISPVSAIRDLESKHATLVNRRQVQKPTLLSGTTS